MLQQGNVVVNLPVLAICFVWNYAGQNARSANKNCDFRTSSKSLFNMAACCDKYVTDVALPRV